MYRLRPFLNSDSPRLAAIWRSQPPQRGLIQPISASLLEYGVFSRIHFDREGLIVAEREGQACGFVHAGFGATDDGAAPDWTMGTTIVLMVSPAEAAAASLADQLLAASEDFLRGRGAKVLYAGGVNPLNAFYLGLYGGSEIPGVLNSDVAFQEACLRNNYREIDQVKILQCDLGRFRPPVSIQQRQIKRTTNLVETIDPPPSNWWDACVWGSLQRDCFQLVDRENRVLARASFWDMQPISACWGMSAAGLYELYVDPSLRRRGYASYVVTEAIRILQRRGVTTIEAQTMTSNDAALAFYDKLGFLHIDGGRVYRKENAAS